MRTYVKFVWRPVILSEYRKPYWHKTNNRAWLCLVRVVETAWFETFYCELEAGDLAPYGEVE